MDFGIQTGAHFTDTDSSDSRNSRWEVKGGYTMVGNTEVPRTLTLTPTLTPTECGRDPTGMGAECFVGNVCIGRAHIEVQTPIVDDNTFWTSWLLLTCPKTPWLALV